MTGPIQRLQVNIQALLAVLERVKEVLSEEDHRILRGAVETLGLLTQLLENHKTTIQRLRQMLFGASTEKTRNVLKKNAGETAAGTANGSGVDQSSRLTGETGKQGFGSDSKPKGHGRNGAAAYSGATRIRVDHESLKAGDCCPLCEKGKLYASMAPGFLVRIVGQAPIGATVYEIENLRCGLCLEVFRAAAPEGVGDKKYDETAGSMMGLLKYGSGTPFYRLERLQGSVGIPLPASTQWEIVHEVAGVVEPALGELIRQAAQGEILHNDDTTMKILALMKASRADTGLAIGSGAERERSGIFTSGIVSIAKDRRITLFFTGHQHAGENLADVLKQRASELGPPIQMCDALSRNVPQEFEVILANCVAHGRRRFVEVVHDFPEECRYVLETLGEVYKNDAVTRERKMSPEERLAFHQVQSGPLMGGLKQWFEDQFAQRKVEPNSGLGQAISYMIKHWEPLTLFLRVAGAPLDNSVAEQALKKSVLHRKNALFFKTSNGAHVGDVFMSLIHTCEQSGANPFDYLTELQRHSEELSRNPEDWMPWNYRETIRATRAAPARAA
jgi:transposase